MVGTGEDALSALGGSRELTKGVPLNGVIRTEGDYFRTGETGTHCQGERASPGKVRGGVVGGRIEMLTVLKKPAKTGLKRREAEGTERQRAVTQRCLKKRRKPEEPPRRWGSPKESEDVYQQS